MLSVLYFLKVRSKDNNCQALNEYVNDICNK